MRNSPEAKYKQKRRYYSRNAEGEQARQPWSDEDQAKLFDSDFTDRELAALLKRSLNSIHVRRSLVRKEYAPEGWTPKGTPRKEQRHDIQTT